VGVAEFDSPIVQTPERGREITLKYLTIARIPSARYQFAKLRITGPHVSLTNLKNYGRRANHKCGRDASDPTR